MTRRQFNLRKEARLLGTYSNVINEKSSFAAIYSNINNGAIFSSIHVSCMSIMSWRNIEPGVL